MQALVDYNQHQLLVLNGGRHRLSWCRSCVCVESTRVYIHRRHPLPFSTPQPPNHQPAAGRSKDETLAAAQKFVTVWPPYLDSGKTLPQGRRIPREAAGAFF